MKRYEYFCYDPATGLETFETKSQAKQAAKKAIDRYRYESFNDFWSEDVEEVCWGKIEQIAKGRRTQDRPADVNFDCEYFDYSLVNASKIEYGGGLS